MFVRGNTNGTEKVLALDADGNAGFSALARIGRRWDDVIADARTDAGRGTIVSRR